MKWPWTKQPAEPTLPAEVIELKQAVNELRDIASTLRETQASLALHVARLQDEELCEHN